MLLHSYERVDTLLSGKHPHSGAALQYREPSLRPAYA
jgi:hypothetical protein